MTRDRKPTPTDDRSARPPRYSRTSAEWPCIFKQPIATERLDPAIKKLWESRRSDRPKWGDLRNTFRQQHCYRVNPWGSETCPFEEATCALAFYNAVEQSLNARNPYGYFIGVCRSSGARRADLGVELRARMRTDAEPRRLEGAGMEGLRSRSTGGLRPQPEPALIRGVESGEPVRGVRGSSARPTPLGDVLGTLDLGSPAQPREDGDAEEGGGR